MNVHVLYDLKLKTSEKNFSLSVRPPVCLSVRPASRLFLCLSIRPSDYPPVHPFACLSACLSVWLSTCKSAWLPGCLSVRPFVHLSVRCAICVSRPDA